MDLATKLVGNFDYMEAKKIYTMAYELGGSEARDELLKIENKIQEFANYVEHRKSVLVEYNKKRANESNERKRLKEEFRNNMIKYYSEQQQNNCVKIEKIKSEEDFVKERINYYRFHIEYFMKHRMLDNVIEHCKILKCLGDKSYVEILSKIENIKRLEIKGNEVALISLQKKQNEKKLQGYVKDGLRNIAKSEHCFYNGKYNEAVRYCREFLNIGQSNIDDEIKKIIYILENQQKNNENDALISALYKRAKSIKLNFLLNE